ncbi:MAG: hypothetical protein ACRC7O_11455 [Fimbriiglobus sp.]
MFAASEPFWKSPNVYDVAGIAGFVIGIGSIWFSWRLARTDIGRRIHEASERAAAAARDEVRRVADTLLRASILDTTRTLELAREACRGRQWSRAVDLCLQSRQELERIFAGQLPLGMADDELRQISTNLKDCVASLRAQPKPGTGNTPRPSMMPSSHFTDFTGG